MATSDARPAPAGGGAIAEYFKFAERGTDLATEIKAGVTTFMVMAYILFVNPFILANMVGHRARRRPRHTSRRRRRPPRSSPGC